MVREPLAAEVGLGQLVPLDHRPHRAVEDEDALREQRVERVSRIVSAHRWPLPVRLVSSWSWRAGLVPDAISTVNGSPALRAPTPTLTSRRPAAASMRFSSSSSKPSDRSPSLARTHSSLVLAQIEHQHAAAGHRDPRRLGDGARRVVRVVQRLRQQRDVDRARP